jgi:hypothetical protein
MAMTLAALREARNAGYRIAILTASPSEDPSIAASAFERTAPSAGTIGSHQVNDQTERSTRDLEKASLFCLQPKLVLHHLPCRMGL